MFIYSNNHNHGVYGEGTMANKMAMLARNNASLKLGRKLTPSEANAVEWLGIRGSKKAQSVFLNKLNDVTKKYGENAQLTKETDKEQKKEIGRLLSNLDAPTWSNKLKGWAVVATFVFMGVARVTDSAIALIGIVPAVAAMAFHFVNNRLTGKKHIPSLMQLAKELGEKTATDEAGKPPQA
jgi:hypothetical protein